MTDALTDPSPEPLAGLLRHYRPEPGVPDEMLDGRGEVRPIWRDFLSRIARMSAQERAQRMERGDLYVRETGMFHRQYGAEGSVERDWPLSHFPVLVDEAEWEHVARGLKQRADLLEAVLADLYDGNRLVAEGLLPPTLVARNPEWLRPLAGVRPRSGHYLHFVAFDLGRGADGAWRVLADRTQAPSGAGFVLETRIATAHVFSDIYTRAPVHRLAGFFRAFREALQAQRGNDGGRIAILTPGRHNETYFEHAYIARYLGFLLVEGEDLAVRDGRVMVRTISGLQPVSVLWRRIDADWTDPLELNDASRIGVPGLVSTVRRGGVTMVNALGSGAVEMPGFSALLPRICETLRGEPLLLASTLEHETAALSTTPAFVDGRLRPRRLGLRMFLARTEEGWAVMPGGFARIGASGDPAALAMQRGGAAADVWVMSRGTADRQTLLASATVGAQRTTPYLPSRAAENLFWLGRYVERAEFVIRLLRAWHVRLVETGLPESALLRHLAAFLRIYGAPPDGGIPQGLSAAVGSALAAAGQVRERFSVDGWMALNDLDRTLRKAVPRAEPGADAARMTGVLLRKINGFSGLVHENMYQSMGWRFLSMGRALERALAMVDALAWFAEPAAPEGALDVLVEIGDSVMSHRRRFAVATNRDTVIDLLALDPLNPRAVLFQLRQLDAHIDALPGSGPDAPLTALERAVVRLCADVATAGTDELDSAQLADVAARIRALSDLLATAYLG
ncbi:circularly permuted type 2 ATP-grasp protein [Pseudochelatococcus lubricantis]|uniref:circularly permuted type 2 ATP-grasp protein n=1 Tax=Pseudochelatococcus lubricantis TaxID=1538102 RepID=UPI0035E8ABF3